MIILQPPKTASSEASITAPVTAPWATGLFLFPRLPTKGAARRIRRIFPIYLVEHPIPLQERPRCVSGGIGFLGILREKL
jgi:hypothetical protein